MVEIPMLIIYFILFTSLYFEVFLLLSFFDNKNKKGNKIKIKKFPSVSIIVPCYNEEKTIERTINSLLSLNYPKDKLKIFIVNDGSKDNTLKVANLYKKINGVKILNKENEGKHSALNLALKHIDTEIVGCLDADSFVTENAMLEILKKFENPEIMAVTPSIKVWRPKNIIQLIQKTEYMFSIFIRKTFSFVNSQFVTPGPFSMFRREIFEKVGIFKKAHNTEDMEMCFRIQSFKYKIENSPKAIVYTNAPNKLSSLFRQRIRWTYGFIKNVFDYKFMFFNKQYGTLGILILPLVMFSIFSGIYFAGFSLFKLTENFLNFIDKINLIGFQFNPIKIDWFFMNINALPIITLFIVSLTIFIIYIGKKISKEAKVWTPDILFYIFLYGLIAPIWLSKSVYNVIFSKKMSWAKEHDKR